MNDLRAAAQQALNYWESASFGDAVMVDKMDALRAALAQQAEPVEPVAWMYAGVKQDGIEHGPHLVWTKLYTSPPQRKPLTEKDLRKLADKHLFYQLESYEASGVFALSRAVERAHGIKE